MRKLALGLVFLAACSTSSRVPDSAGGKPGEDAIRLTSGEVVRGKIVEETPRHVVIDRETAVSSYPRAAIYAVDYSKERAPVLRPSDPPPGSARPPGTWLPRTDRREPVRQTEVLFYDAHGPGECLGDALWKTCLEFPDLTLFGEPGGKIVMHDPRRWGYHAHLTGGALRIPQGKPGLEMALPREEAKLPEGIAIVSPAQEIKAGEGEGRTSYAIPDSIYAVVKPASTAEAALAMQPFAGGRPSPTANGKLWAFALPRNSRQFFVYLYDSERKHGATLKGAYAGYGDTILAADVMIDMIGADGVAVGRVLVVPYPDSVSADGPAPEPVTIYAGPTADPTRVAQLVLPPREAIHLPAKAASVRADILVSHYEVSASVPQSVVLAHGVGRPTKEVALIARALTPAEPDQIVKIDLSAQPEERFPSVVWLYQRRTFAWKSTGGMLRRGEPLAVPSLRGDPPRLTRVKKSEGIPHVIPLLFIGPRPSAIAAREESPGAGVAGGMSSALLTDALGREATGGIPGSGSSSPLTPTGPGGGGGGPGGTPEGGGNVSNVTNVYITSPPHLPGDMAAPSAATPSPSGMFLSTGGTPHSSVYNPSGLMGTSVLGPYGYHDAQSGIYRDPHGNVTYDPNTGRVGSLQENNGNDSPIGIDTILGNPTLNFSRRRGP